MTREEAKRRGLKWYRTGKLCIHGHRSKRLVSNRSCYTCARPRTRAYQRNKWATDPAYRKRVYATSLVSLKRRLQDPVFRARISAYVAARHRKRRLVDPLWAALENRKGANWRRLNRGAVNAYQTTRKALEKGSRCRCCSAHAIRVWYVEAARRGREVDHRKALKLGGRHCCKNFQLLTPLQHRVKTSRDLRLIALERRS